MKTLVALDGSPDSFNALTSACRMALKTGAYVTAFYVNKSESYSTEDTGWVSIREKIEKELELRGQEVIRRAAAVGRELGVPIEGIMAYGIPAEEIAKYCAARGIVNLVAMGHSSKRRGTQGFVGSTTRMVLSALERASLFVTSKAGEITRVLIAVDGTEASLKAVATAGRLAQALGAEVRLLSVVPDTQAILNEYRQIAEVPNVDRYLRESEALQERRARQGVEAATQALARLGLKATGGVERGTPSEVIIGESRTADLTALGVGVRSGQKRIGKVLEDILASEEISLLCVQ